MKEFIGVSNLGPTAYRCEKFGIGVRVEKYNFTWGHNVGVFSKAQFIEWCKDFAPNIDPETIFEAA